VFQDFLCQLDLMNLRTNKASFIEKKHPGLFEKNSTVHTFGRLEVDCIETNNFITFGYEPKVYSIINQLLKTVGKVVAFWIDRKTACCPHKRQFHRLQTQELGH
jgi:hypothetical protein